MIEVILTEHIDRLGKFGEVVKVRPGYARNYLLRQRKAMRATKSNLDLFEKQRAQLEEHNARLRSTAEAKAKEIDGLTLMLIRQASESGALYGSVTPRDIAESAEAAGCKLERRAIEIAAPIKTTGLYTIDIRFHPEVTAAIKVNVARSEEDGRSNEADAAKAAQPSEEPVAEFTLPGEIVHEDAPAEASPEAEEARPVKKRAAKKKAAASEEG